MLETIRSLLQYRGTRVITCPETGCAEAVRVDAPHAAWTALTGDAPDLRLESCTRWPERQGCAETCVKQIETSPDGCLVLNLLRDWYDGKSCAQCRKPFHQINWTDHRPALMSPDSVTHEWSEIDPRDLPQVLKTYLPVCWNCHVADTFRREHADMVTDRDWKH